MKQQHGIILGALVAGFVGGALAVSLAAFIPAKAAGSEYYYASGMSVSGHDGKQRIQLGTYDGSYAPAEKGQPMFGLWDNSGNLRMLLRLAGSNESPVIVFKDREHHDRLVMGLDMTGSEEAAFATGYDQSGHATTLWRGK